MKKQNKSTGMKARAFILCLALALFVVQKTAAETISGTCSATGSDVSWSLDTSTGKLVLSGTGSMVNYSSNFYPWRQYQSDIHSVVINSGVTSIGNGLQKRILSLCPAHRFQQKQRRCK